MDQLGFSFDTADEAPQTPPAADRALIPERNANDGPTASPTTPEASPERPGPLEPGGRRITGLAEIHSDTAPIERCSLDSCNEHAARWVVFDHAPAFTAFCAGHAPENPWWTRTAAGRD